MQITQRLTQYVARSFSDDLSEDIIASLERLDGEFLHGQDAERVGAAIVILVARGVAVDSAVGLAKRDWRDLLVAAKLGSEDWRDVLAALLGDGDK